MSNKTDKRAHKKQQKQQQQTAKHGDAKNGIVPISNKRVTLTLNKRNELTVLVKKLLAVCFVSPSSPKESWQQFLNLSELLEQVQALEAALQRPSSNATTVERMQNIENFQKWAIENGCQGEGVAIAEFAGFDLGLKAERKFAEGEQVITVPRKLMLTEDNLDNEYMQPKFGVMSNVKLTYTFMCESLKQNSFWAPYIKILPNTYTSVAYFNKQHMELLRGSNVLTTALKLWRSVARQYAFIYDMLQNMPRRNKSEEVANAIKDCFSYELYRWAMSVVMTRENMIPRNRSAKHDDKQPDLMIALVPYWDMLNHRAGRVTTVFDVDKQQLEMTAPAEFAAGEQLFIHYGNRCNAEMLLHNGFVDVNNKNDYVPIKLGLSATDPLRVKRAELLQLVSADLLSQNVQQLQVLPAPDYFSEQLLAFVRIFNMNEQQLDHWIESQRAQDLKHIDCALETQLEQKTWHYLQTRMMLQLRSFPTTLQEDEARLAKVRCGEISLSVIETNILQYLVLEKRILSAALEHAQQRIKA